MEMASIESIEGKTSGRGEDLFLLSLLITCLKVSRYPNSMMSYILRIDSPEMAPQTAATSTS